MGEKKGKKTAIQTNSQSTDFGMLTIPPKTDMFLPFAFLFMCVYRLQ